MKLRGRVLSGIANFSKKMEEVPDYVDAYERKTGMRFYPGTLNVQLNEAWSVPNGSMLLEKGEYSGERSVYIVPCSIFGRKAYILRTEKSESGLGFHPKNVVELASDVKLRDICHLKDGDEVEIIVGHQ